MQFMILAGLLLGDLRDAATADDASAVIGRAIGYLDGRGAEIEKGASCVNCHHVPLRSWALREASLVGATVDQKAIVEAAAVQMKRVVELKDDYRDKHWDHTLSSIYLLSGLIQGDAQQPAPISSELVQIIVAGQLADGNWKAAQQFANQRRPKKDAEEAQTMWNLLSIANSVDRPGVRETIDKGLKYLQAKERGTTIDSRVLRILIER